jgi:hypothetical protein
MAIRRQTLVRAALAAAVTASLGLLAAGGEQPGGAQPASVALAPTSAERSAPSTESTQALRLDLLQREAQAIAAKDAFAAHSWYQPPPAPKLEPPPPPPPPSAPALPFTFLGTFEANDGKPVFYLAEGDQLHTVKEGEVINGTWRVQSISVDQMVLLYLPLSLPQTLALGSPQ